MMSNGPLHNRPAGTRVAWCVVIGLCWVGAAWPQSVVLQLKNGDRLTGVIVNEDTNRIVITTKWVKDLAVPAAEIARRETNATPAVAATPPPVPGPAVPTAAAMMPAAPVSKPANPKHWAGEVQLGLDLAFSEKDRQLYSGRAKVAYTHSQFRNLSDYSFSYGRTDGVLSANRMDGLDKMDFDVGRQRRFFVYNLVGAGYDQIRLINYRYEAGPGFGCHIVRRPTFALNSELGANYQVQYRADHTRTEHFYYRLAEDSTWKINSRMTVDERFEYFPLYERLDEFRLRAEMNLRYLLWGNLTLTLTVLDQFDTMPARSVPENDLQIRSLLGMKF